MSSALRAPHAHKMYTLRSTACFLLTAFVSVLAFQPFVGIVFFVLHLVLADCAPDTEAGFPHPPMSSRLRAWGPLLL
jgi:hypothetical protein